MQKNITIFLLVIMGLVGAMHAGALSSSVANTSVNNTSVNNTSVDAQPAAPTTATEPVIAAVAPAQPEKVQTPVLPPTEESSVPVAPVVLEEVTPKEQVTVSSDQPTIQSEQAALNQTIAQDIAVEPKVFSPAPDITQKTPPSKPLQEESAQLTPEKIAVDDKEFGEQPEPRVQPAQEIQSDLDTTAVDAGGNWLKKRAFWEQAERTYEKIMEANSAIYEQQIKFVKARNEADDLSDKSFRELGFEQGQLSNLLDRLLDELKVQRETQGLTEQERQLLQTLKEKQQEVEQLKLNLQAIDDLDNVLDQTMLKLNTQVTACRSYEKNAWENFKTIGRELNDKKARVLFYEMEGFLKTVEKNREYISGQLWQYVNDTVASIKTKFDELATAVSAARQKGVDLTNEFNRFVQADRQKEELVVAPEPQKPAPVVPQTWWGTLVGGIKVIWHYWTHLVSRAFAWVGHLFGK